MAVVIKDRVKVTSTTTGTGTFTLGSAMTGFQNFSVVGDGNTTYYTITDNTNWEVGVGTYSSTGPTLSRDTILESSNSNSAVNFGAGTKYVFLTLPAEKAITVDNIPTTLSVLNRSGSLISVPITGGLLPVLNRSGSTIYVPVNT